MISFVDAYRDDYGVEPICRVLEIAPSTYHAYAARRAKPETAPARVKRDTTLSVEIKRVFNENFQVYGVRKVWRQLLREGYEVARCTVARLMKKIALQGVIRGRRVRTTVSDKATPCPLDHVNRRFRAPRPNMLWVSDFTYVATWTGFVYVAFVIDAYARRIVGWRVSRSAHAGFVLDALEQALHERKPVSGALVHHSDRGVQYVSIKYTERLAEAGLVPSVGSVGDSYDNALAETINGLYKAEVIHRRGPWRSLEAVEYATLEWVDWFNNRRLLEPIGHVPPAEAEAAYTQPWRNLPHSQPDFKPTSLRESGTVHNAICILLEYGVSQGTGSPDAHGAPCGANRVETCRVPPPFLNLPLSDVLAPSRRLACVVLTQIHRVAGRQQPVACTHGPGGDGRRDRRHTGAPAGR